MTFRFYLLGTFNSVKFQQSQSTGGGGGGGGEDAAVHLTRGPSNLEIENFCVAGKPVKCVGGTILPQ